MSAAEEQQCPSHGILCGIAEIRFHHQMLELVAVVMVFVLVELVPQEFADDFGFIDRPQYLHAASCSIDPDLNPRLRNGMETRSSSMDIKTIWTTITCGSV